MTTTDDKFDKGLTPNDKEPPTSSFRELVLLYGLTQGNTMILLWLVLLIGDSVLVESMTTPAADILCHSCNNASTLADCPKLVQCDRQTEDCYMDEIITDSALIVYYGGCRAKDVCQSAASSGNFGFGLGRKRELTACSRCCKDTDRCNSRLCGIYNPVVTTTPRTSIAPADVLLCYSCNNARGLQDCTTFDQCDRITQECYIDEVITATSQIRYNGGCREKKRCNQAGSSLFGVGKRFTNDIISCSRCCNAFDKCNDRLCAIQTSSILPTPAPQDFLVCRLCNKALTLYDCALTHCDRATEECFMEKMITGTLQTVYDGGCRAKDSCRALNGLDSSPLGRRDLVSCSRCCNTTDQCNDQLCFIPPATTTKTTTTTLPTTTTALTTTLSPFIPQTCRVCNANASTLSDCTDSLQCNRTEECFMDKIITDSLVVVYRGGCRRHDICASASSGRRRELVACSRCCKTTDHCNEQLCDIPKDACQSSPCKNGGSCESLPGTFHCHCAAGYKGRYCDQDFDECQYERCYNGGTCINVDNGFNCSCPVGFTGHQCETHEDCSSVNATPCWQLISLHKCKRIHSIADVCMKQKCDRCMMDIRQPMLG